MVSLITIEKTKWYNEGFTDYLAYRIQYYIEMFKKEDWYKVVAKKQEEYELTKKTHSATMEQAVNDKSRY